MLEELGSVADGAHRSPHPLMDVLWKFFPNLLVNEDPSGHASGPPSESRKDRPQP